MKELMLGNKAVARGLYEAGCMVVSSYPGTPSTEITEETAKYDEVYCEWAPNEKVALEAAHGATVGGRRSACAMKHVGLNVAADPLFTISYQGVNAGLVICVADDPGMHSSQNEQDSRHYAKAAKVPMLEPSDSQEALEFTKKAFELSEKYNTPVFIKMCTRVSHSQSVVETGVRVVPEQVPYVKDPAKVMMTLNSRNAHVRVEQRTKDLIALAENCDFNRVEYGDKKLGIITSSTSYQYARECFGENASILKLGMIYPLPEKLILDFAASVDEVIVLEELDPSENYKGTALEGLDAFQRQLKRFDIKVSGKSSDRVEKFFDNSDSAALFPEYVSRAVAVGVERSDVIPDIVAATTRIDGMDYRSITSDPSDDKTTFDIVKETATIPETVIKTQGSLISLNKRGRILSASYEALRFQRLDLFTVMLSQIGMQIAREQLKDAVSVILNGDGNKNPATVISATGEIDYTDLVSLWAGLAPYELNTILAPTALMQKLLALPEMRDASAGLTFHGTGSMITPLGAKLIHVPSMDANTIIGLDKNCSLELVESGGVITDYDKLIDRQLERAAISITTGFGKICASASKAMKLS